MPEQFKVIQLEERFSTRRPPPLTLERDLFDIAILGIKDMNMLAKPFLRGFDVLKELKPIFPEIGDNLLVDKQRLHRLETDISPFGLAAAHVLLRGEDRAKNGVTPEVAAELDSATRYIHFLQRNFKKPDTDFELNNMSIMTPDTLAKEWERYMTRSTEVIDVAYEPADFDLLRDKDALVGHGAFTYSHRYGYRGEKKVPRPGIEIFSLDIGPLTNMRSTNGVLRVDWTAGANKKEKVFDMRWGVNGLYPTDSLRATQLEGEPLIFKIGDRSFAFPQVSDGRGRRGDGIKFPSKKEVLMDPHRYLELASRGMMQSIWHNLILEMPRSKPRINWAELQDHYLQFPRQRLAFIDKVVDAFMVDPKRAFELSLTLGLFDGASALSYLSDEKLNYIFDNLPGREEHFKNLIEGNGNYSVFEKFINLLNETIPDLQLDPKKDLMVFYEDIFPSGKEHVILP